LCAEIIFPAIFTGAAEPVPQDGSQLSTRAVACIIHLLILVKLRPMCASHAEIDDPTISPMCNHVYGTKPLDKDGCPISRRRDVGRKSRAKPVHCICSGSATDPHLSSDRISLQVLCPQSCAPFNAPPKTRRTRNAHGGKPRQVRRKITRYDVRRVTSRINSVQSPEPLSLLSDLCKQLFGPLSKVCASLTRIAPMRIAPSTKQQVLCRSQPVRTLAAKGAPGLAFETWV
jgi:hypothetical protein